MKKDNKGYILEVDVGAAQNHNELPFLPERMKIGNVGRLVPNLNKKKKYVILIKALDQALKHGLVLKTVHRAIKFEQSEWLEP